jgi:hypothetical protein
LNCVTVQRLAAGPLDAAERRALKTHLRTCGDCRQAMGLRGRALSVFPSGAGLEWLRGLGAGLIGGGAPAAAKVGAIFATATIVGGGTVAVEQTNHRHAQHPVLQVARATPVTQQVRPPASLGTVAVQVAAVSAPVHTRAEHATRDRGSSHDSTPGEREAPQQLAEHDSSSTDDRGSHDQVATVTIGREDGSSHEHSGQASEPRHGDTQQTETQPTETQPTASEEPPQDTSTTTETTTTTTTEVTVPPPPGVPVIINPE